MHKKLIIIIILFSITGCIFSGQPKERSKKDDQLIFLQAQKAIDAKDYVDAIQLLQIFTEKFPDSDIYSMALQRLGESFEGLLELEYSGRIKNGEKEHSIKKEFLANYGKYNCWKEKKGGLKYNLTHYKLILEKYPDSPIADEAAYRMIPWEDSYNGKPDGPLKELNYLEDVLQKYPTTSLRPEILYKLAYRCHILYEMYAFSGIPGIKDEKLAAKYINKALFTYKLVLDSPTHTNYSKKAWEGLNSLEQKKRIYIFDQGIN
jgi:hypothetical protein